MKRGAVAVMGLIVGGLTGGVLAPAAGAHLAPAPSICTVDPLTDPNCIEKGGGGDTSVSPKLVRVGQVVTFKLTPDGISIAAPAKGWTIGNRPIGPGSSPAGLKLLGCRWHRRHVPGGPFDVADVLSGPAICRYRVTSAGRGWQAAVANFDVRYGALASYSEEGWRVVPKGTYIEGHIHGRPDSKGASGTPLVNVPVAAHGPSYDSTTTNNEGYYVLQLKKAGRYKVVASLRSIDLKLRPHPTFSPGSRIVHATSKAIKNADFRLSRGDDVTITFLDSAGKTIGTLPADGVSSATAQVDALDANDQPLNDQPLDLAVDGNTLGTKAIVCDANNMRLWPGTLVGTTRSAQVITGGDTNETPDSSGHLNLTVYAGTDVGSVSITARRHGASPVYDVTRALALTAPPSFGSLQMTDLHAKSGYGATYPNPQPLDPSGEDSWWYTDLYYLADAKTHGYFTGWEYAPVVTTSGGPQRYGIYFYANGNSGGGGVLETKNYGLGPLENGNPLPSVGTWSAGQPYAFQHLVTGYPGDDLFYFGWPYERTGADACIRRAPD